MSTGGIQRFVTLPCAPESARQARRFVTEILTVAGAEEFLDTATLLTSELVTNGIVHAHTDLQLVVDATSHWVRVEVIDGNPTLPARRDYDDEALTGRGLEMVELLSDDFGMSPLAEDGKRVWFRLGHAPRDAEPEPTAPESAPVATMRLHLMRLPVQLYCAWQQHSEAMLREAVIAALDDGPVPDDIASASETLSALAADMAPVFELRDDGRVPDTDVDVTLPAELAVKFPLLGDVLRRCSAKSLAGLLLVPPSLPEIQVVRDWIIDEVSRQLAGLEPKAWEPTEGEELPFGDVPESVVAAVLSAPVATVAADRMNRLIAANDAAAELLGWRVEDLVGRRLVAIIPPRLRDAHIAGFTRHLLGGPPRILGSEVPLPALHRDGSEQMMLVKIDRQQFGDGDVFVATLRPLS